MRMKPGCPERAKKAACAPTALAMVGSTLLGRTITPATVIRRYAKRYYVCNAGSAHALILRFARDYGLRGRYVRRSLSRAAEVINRGGLAIVLADAGYFTGKGHFLVLYRTKGNQFWISDPNGHGKRGDSESHPFSSSFLLGRGNVTKVWTFERP
jgi:ABC-type bacteriocin/lantibiotic exporter with double-glycine peptidase domain